MPREESGRDETSAFSNEKDEEATNEKHQLLVIVVRTDSPHHHLLAQRRVRRMEQKTVGQYFKRTRSTIGQSLQACNSALLHRGFFRSAHAVMSREAG